MKHVFNCARPRLSDEEIDPIEQDEIEQRHSAPQDGWVPWTLEDLFDIQRIIETRMPQKQREVVEAFLSGTNFNELGVTEKYYRYHFEKAVEFIRLELKL